MGDTAIDKIIAIYNCVSELANLSSKVETNLEKHEYYLFLEEIPTDSNFITLNLDEEGVLLKVRKPKLTECPKPHIDLEEWLVDGWDNYSKEVEHKDTLDDIIYFGDSDARVNHYNDWIEERTQWMLEERENRIIDGIFTKLYKVHNDFKNDSESNELIIANGIIKDRMNSNINYPIITKRIKTEFDPEENVITLVDTDLEPKLYTSIFTNIEDINHAAISLLDDELTDKEYYPVGESVQGYFKRFAHELSSDSFFIESKKESVTANMRITIEYNPVIILRNRISGVVGCVDHIIKNIENTNYVPEALLKLVNGSGEPASETDKELSIAEQLAAVCGEDIDIYLSKEANKEQLEIAKRIEKSSAVVVQGPPGTGKTHTIANLLGHFLAQGKSVLVTSYTKKALSVLKEKVSPDIKDLCVSMLDDSNVDMQTSIENIGEKRAGHTAAFFKKKIDSENEVRNKIIEELAATREKIYNLRQGEHNSIVINGESTSPSEMANYVTENKEHLSYIPGKVSMDAPSPLSLDEFDFLYKTNTSISAEEEDLLNISLPDMNKLLEPNVFRDIVNSVRNDNDEIEAICKNNNWTLRKDKRGDWYFGTCRDCRLDIDSTIINDFDIKDVVLQFDKKWHKFAALSGLKEDVSLIHWETLIDALNEAADTSNKYAEISFGKKVDIDEGASEFLSVYEEMEHDFINYGKLSKLKLAINRGYKDAINLAQIDGHQIKSKDDCRIVIEHLKLLMQREKCASYWDSLLKDYGVKDFYGLDFENPELIAVKYIPEFNRYLDWGKVVIHRFIDSITSIGIDYKEVFHITDYIDGDDKFEVLICKSATYINDLLKMLKALEHINTSEQMIESSCSAFTECVKSDLSEQLKSSLREQQTDAYEKKYCKLELLIEKKEAFIRRKMLLDKLRKKAPEWADEISGRCGFHGRGEAPESIHEAWKWNQYKQYLSNLLSMPFNELLKKSTSLSQAYRDATSKLASSMAWFHLVSRLERNPILVQNLESWRQIVARIGKGTGKRAATFKKEARDLMGKCQKAVPCWIMTINKAIETLDPIENHFDIVIVDEASQADISSLAVAYMAEKIIVVGDDKQVSPMAVGQSVDKIDAIAERTIRGLTPYWRLFDSKFSLYALASTSYKSMMLKEHFRCVPEIIGFSNKLSYDFKIKPLRDSGSSNLKPAIVPFRVNGKRGDGKTNVVEANYIVALIKACIEQPEYKDKTFGIISLLGREQAALIYQKLIAGISPIEMEKRNILCGDASNFQGDERNVIFLSMVDSSREEGTLKKADYGPDDFRRKRYNVAVSRAKDQLWIIHSLDASNDLKAGDIRKELLDYAVNPEEFLQQIDSIKEKADSPFEIEVAERLVSNGYKIAQQWKVGAYSIDIVAIYNNKKVAIECDGERWHSGYDKVREDMERQTILERSGWTFIRIRGSEFYSDKDATMQRVYNELNLNGIYPEEKIEDNGAEYELLDRIKARASDFVSDDESYTDTSTIGYALNVRSRENYAADTNLEKDSGFVKSQESIRQIEFPEWLEEYKLHNSKSKDIESKNLNDNLADCQEGMIEANKVESSPKAKKSKKVVKKGTKNINQSSDKSTESRIIKDLKSLEWEFIDNTESSDIIWLICNPEIKAEQEKYLDSLPYIYSYEKRGTISTNNRKAWRIMIRKEK